VSHPLEIKTPVTSDGGDDSLFGGGDDDDDDVDDDGDGDDVDVHADVLRRLKKWAASGKTEADFVRAIDNPNESGQCLSEG
jgi:hypothetical protein